MCNHDGKCSGRLTRSNDRLIRELICDHCGDNVGGKVDVGEHDLNPNLTTEAAA